MTPFSITGTVVLGFVLGLRHALDADHLAAVATILGGRDGLRRSLLVGFSWGAGHALALGTVGGVLVALRVAVPEQVGLLFEFAVAVMLIGLGTAAVVGALRERLHAHEHAHGAERHAHLHFHIEPDGGEGAHHHAHLRPGLRPFLVGSLHGLAGTGALVLLVLTTLPSVSLGLLYLGVFGAGSIAGMALMSLTLGAPLVIASRRAGRLYGVLRAAAGIGSLGLGLYLAWQIGLGRGLLS
jgi:ABC-type nickel/cobalt efflux system permease component RcnA